MNQRGNRSRSCHRSWQPSRKRNLGPLSDGPKKKKNQKCINQTKRCKIKAPSPPQRKQKKANQKKYITNPITKNSN